MHPLLLRVTLQLLSVAMGRRFLVCFPSARLSFCREYNRKLDKNEILSKVVYAERAHPVEMISKVSLGGLLDLFLTVDEFDARYDFGEQFRTVEPAPVFLGFQAQFKDHGQCRDS